MSAPEMVTVAEVARRWGVAPETVRKMCRNRTHPYMWADGSVYCIIRAGFEKHMAGEEVRQRDLQPVSFLHRIERRAS